MKMDLRPILVAGLVLSFAVGAVPASASEQSFPSLLQSEMESGEAWKGESYGHPMEAGALMGMGVFDGSVGFGVLASGAFSIDQDGFIDEVNEQFFLEGYLGPVFFGEGTAFNYGLHGRWDFNRDKDWSFFATGGLAGTITGDALGNAWRLYPRFSVGVLRNLTSTVRLRAEISHDLMALGASYRF